MTEFVTEMNQVSTPKGCTEIGILATYNLTRKCKKSYKSSPPPRARRVSLSPGWAKQGAVVVNVTSVRRWCWLEQHVMLTVCCV